MRRSLGYMACLCVAVALLCGCSERTLPDEPDSEGYAMTYSYAPYGIEEFAEHIRSLRHYLFDASGAYLGEVAPSADLTLQPLELAPGSYTMVTLGNATEQTVCAGAGQGLDSFRLQVSRQEDPSAECAVDDLYWGTCRFTVEPKGTVALRLA